MRDYLLFLQGEENRKSILMSFCVNQKTDRSDRDGSHVRSKNSFGSLFSEVSPRESVQRSKWLCQSTGANTYLDKVRESVSDSKINSSLEYRRSTTTLYRESSSTEKKLQCVR